MPISIICPGCDKKLQAPDTAAGKTVRCPACDAVVAVPESELLNDRDEGNAVSEVLPSPIRKKCRSAEDDEGSDFDQDDDRPRKEKRTSRFDDDDDDYRRSRRIAHQPHRGVWILCMGILALFFGCLCPPIAFTLGGYVLHTSSHDLEQMASRRMDAFGHGMTLGGRICAIIGVVLGVVVVIAFYALGAVARH